MEKMKKKIREFRGFDRENLKTSVLYDAGCISGRLGLSRRGKKVNVTFPPLPLTFEGMFDLMPFLAYKSITIDEGSWYYFFEEPVIEPKAKTLLGSLKEEGRIHVIDYEKKLKSVKEKICSMGSEIYERIKTEAIRKRHDSLFYQHKEKWLMFIRYLDAQSRKSYLMETYLDNTNSVIKTLKRIKVGRLIPKDYLFLHENLMDVCCVYNLSQMIKLPIHAWGDWSEYYRYIMEKHDPEHLLTGENKVELARALWKLYLPDIRLEEIDRKKFLRLLDTYAVHLLQDFIQKSRFKPDTIDIKFYQETQKAVSNMYKSAKRYRTLSSIGWATIGVAITDIFPYSATVSVPCEIATQKAISKIYRIKEKRKFPWKVALEDIGKYLSKDEVSEITREVAKF